MIISSNSSISDAAFIYEIYNCRIRYRQICTDDGACYYCINKIWHVTILSDRVLNRSVTRTFSVPRERERERLMVTMLCTR